MSREGLCDGHFEHSPADSNDENIDNCLDKALIVFDDREDFVFPIIMFEVLSWDDADW